MSESESEIVKKARVLSIDVFRGVTIILMIFVNHMFDLKMKNIPQWLKHMPKLGITMSDMIFPAFLFIVGMAIPLALDKRIDRGDKWYQLLWRVLVRSMSLIIAGFYWVNYNSYNKDMGLLPKDLWGFLMFISIILVWNNYPKVDTTKWGSKRVIYTGLQWLGFVTLLFLSFTYTSFGPKGLNHPAFTLEPRWWQMLGAIGWAYLLASLYYLVFRNNLTALVLGIPLFLLVYIGKASGNLKFVDEFIKIVNIQARGAHTAIVLAGVVLQKFFETNSNDKPKKDSNYERIKWILIFGLLIFISGVLEVELYRITNVDTQVLWTIFIIGIVCILLYIFNNDFEERMKSALNIGGILMVLGLLMGNLYKIAKNGATPSWVLVCSGACCIVYVLTYYLVDQKKYRGGLVQTILPPANNPLLIYLLPELLIAGILAFGLGGILKIADSGILGILRAVLWTAFIVWLTTFLSKKGVNFRF